MSAKRKEEGIYHLLNLIGVDFAQQTEVLPADEVERQRVKRELRRRIRMEQIKKQRKIASKAVAAAAVLVIGTTGFCMVYPAYAREIPVIGDIYKLFSEKDGGLYENYKANATEVGETKTDNGIAITLNDVIFDGKTLTYTFSAQSDKDLGAEVMIDEDLHTDRSHKVSGIGGGTRFEKVGEGLYAGQSSRTMDHAETPDGVLRTTWKVTGIRDLENHKDYECKVKFYVETPVLEGRVLKLEEKLKTTDGNAAVTLEKLTATEANCTLDYAVEVKGDPYTLYPDQPGRMSDARGDIMLKITDDLGNVYESADNGGYSENEETALHRSLTFQKMKQGVETLTVTAYDFRSEKELGSLTISVKELQGNS